MPSELIERTTSLNFHDSARQGLDFIERQLGLLVSTSSKRLEQCDSFLVDHLDLGEADKVASDEAVYRWDPCRRKPQLGPQILFLS